MYIFFNDSIIDSSKPCIKANDRGLLLGDGIFETMKYQNKQIISLDRHIERLKNSLKYLMIPVPERINDILYICKDLILKNEINNTSIASIRVTVTRGKSERGINIPNQQEPNLLISISTYTPNNNPCKAMITSVVRNEFSYLTNLKTIQYLESIIARREAQESGFDEGIMINTKKILTESSVANIFFVQHNEIITPKISDGVLPGIVREIVINEAIKAGIKVSEKSISQNDISKFTEAFQTNSLIDIQPISQINNIKFKVNNETSLTSNIKQIYKKATGQDT